MLLSLAREKKLAKHNWLGRNNKPSFQKLEYVVKLVVHMVTNFHQDVPARTVEDHIKIYLKNAPGPIKRSQQAEKVNVSSMDDDISAGEGDAGGAVVVVASQVDEDRAGRNSKGLLTNVFGRNDNRYDNVPKLFTSITLT